MKQLYKGEAWVVNRTSDGQYFVFSTDPLYVGERECARAALAGDPDAIAAVMLCSEDTELHRYLRELSDGK